MSIYSKHLIDVLNIIDSWMWGKILIFLLIALGLNFTIRLRGMQFRYLGYSLKLAFTRRDNNAPGDISQFEALMTALAATIGIGSIAGVATAVVGGGFGAVFWMWVTAIVGMTTKFSEAILAVKYRSVDHRGQMCGGPMHYIEKGLKWKWLAITFAFFGALSAFFGGNMTQSNSIAEAIYSLINLPHYWTGIILTLATAVVILGGINSIGKVCAYLVPIMAGMYIIGGLTILVINFSEVPRSFLFIFTSAFTGAAIKGGVLGSGIIAALQYGVARGVSSNEAGLGSSPIAAAAAKTDVPGRQALISMATVFLSTLVVCSITALVISVTGVLGDVGADGRILNGAALVMRAFQSSLPWGAGMVTIGVILFGYSTIVGWAYYGEKCIEYLFGEGVLIYYRLIFCVIIFIGTVLSLDIVWPLVDIMNGLMAFPNLIGLFALSGIVVAESNRFFNLLQQEKELK